MSATEPETTNVKFKKAEAVRKDGSIVTSEDNTTNQAFKEALTRFVALDYERRETEKELATIKQLQDALETKLLEDFAELGMQSTKIGGMTVYLHRRLCASAPNPESLCEAMTDNGFPELVKTSVNVLSLASFVKEYEDKGEPIPEWLAPLVKVSEVFTLRTRKS